MSKVKIAQITLIFVFLATSNIFGLYYYSNDRQIPLYIDSTKILLNFSNDWIYDEENFINEYEQIDSIILQHTLDDFCVYSINSSAIIDHFIDSLSIDPRIDQINYYTYLDPNIPSLMGNTICCKFHNNVSYFFIDSLNSVFHVSIEYENQYTPKQFLLRVNDNSPYSVLDIANLYYELPETEFSHPNFLGGYEYDNKYHIYDHYWQEQWAMHRIFDITFDSVRHKAFEISTGDSSVIVAVLDQGITPHEDLNPNLITPGYDFERMDNDPTACDTSNQGWHGMGIMGIIGANHNRDSTLYSDRNTGIYGIAPGVKIMPIKIGSGIPAPDTLIPDTGWGPGLENCWGWFTTDERIAGAINWAWAHGADILSCSWHRIEPVDVIANAISLSSIVGRDGKGCGIFFSAGNSGSPDSIFPAMLPEVISVGSLHPDDSAWSYSSYGKVDLMAPSGKSAEHPIWTLDQMGNMDKIYEGGSAVCGNPPDYDYNCMFGGTSAAQPVAAGVAALMLSINPDLTREELYEAMKCSAERDLYIPIIDPPQEKYGYGMVHPLRALATLYRGDVDNSGSTNILDITHLIEYLYMDKDVPDPHPIIGDLNCDGLVTLMDITYLINWIYKSGEPPITPCCELGDWEY